MKKQNWKTYALWIVFTEVVGAISGLLSRNGVAIFQQTATKPPLTPPGIVFPIVWAILYGLMGVSAARISLTPPSAQRSQALNLYMIQLAVNFFWSLLFFNAQAYGFSLVWLLLLWILVFWMIVAFKKADPVAAWLQLPYLIWLTFALYLNWGVWQLN